MMMGALVLTMFMMLRRGHPKNWRLGEGWVQYWGGDYAQMQHDMQREHAEALAYWAKKNEERQGEIDAEALLQSGKLDGEKVLEVEDEEVVRLDEETDTTSRSEL